MNKFITFLLAIILIFALIIGGFVIYNLYNQQVLTNARNQQAKALQVYDCIGAVDTIWSNFASVYGMTLADQAEQQSAINECNK